MHFVSWGYTYAFSCKLGLKKIFSTLGGAGAPTAPPGYAYEDKRRVNSSFLAEVTIQNNRHATFSKKTKNIVFLSIVWL